MAEIEQRTPAGIAAAVGRLIATGRLAPADRLPTVRDLATELGVSPATISHAWKALAAAGLIVSRGRSGTFVLDAAPKWLPARSQTLAGPLGTSRLDLSRGTPDPELLPALGPALSRVSQRAVTPSYQDLPVIPELLDVLHGSWPYPVESVTVVDGALDAISRSLDQITRFGDRVIVENPTFPPFFDLLEQLGLERVPVDIDSEGIVPASLAIALRRGPAALLLQPRAQNPTGASMSAARAGELAQVLHASTSTPVVIEDDHSGDISIAPDVSLGQWMPDRVLHVRSFSKSHGPDLRIAALGGPAQLIDPIVARRMLGPGWTSRMLQTILHDLLTNSDSITQVSEARRRYFARQRALTEELARQGLVVPQADGINAWLPVRDERDAIVRLAASGIRVAGGSPFMAAEGGPAFIRVTAGALPADSAPVAAALVAAANLDEPDIPVLTARWA
ncbi:aminotransferase class I/II-fold pyridoxal phosphate-dependent enzyme [Cryobacterium sp. CG_9.6]|uniref:aminotransferase-like domain-containing protein n=1 Tax=Cryobacterium sp. CG_9.6 TaxID=2760710 RepID=UPI002474AB7C|nr:aminotransferase class I/II-fold pyridoxal phosphate-dependent enzyme [Cryobacterium sp. CG_9.6]MDH6235298.1 DNA-binding transcriptional MocR family regulator [Cryobacterium sp. CG_9.6]